MSAGAKKCRGKTKVGEPCQMAPMRGVDYCYVHAPGIDSIRHANRVRAGRAPRNVPRTRGLHVRAGAVGRGAPGPVVGLTSAGVPKEVESHLSRLPKLRTREDVTVLLEGLALEIEGMDNVSARVTCKLKLAQLAMQHTDTRMLDEWRKKLDRMERKLREAQKAAGKPRVVA